MIVLSSRGGLYSSHWTKIEREGDETKDLLSAMRSDSRWMKKNPTSLKGKQETSRPKIVINNQTMKGKGKKTPENSHAHPNPEISMSTQNGLR